MKKIVLLTAALALCTFSYGQWTDEGNIIKTPDHVFIKGKNVLQFGDGIERETHSGRIGYQTYSDGLDIVGAGTTGNERKVTIHAQGGLNIIGSLTNHVFITGKNVLEFGNGLAKEAYAGRIAYQAYSDGLDIVGAGTTGDNRKVTIHAQGGGVLVYGKVHADTYTATTPPWSDFVFEKDYNLRSLESLENYIKENKHLPDVPSETELKETGLNLPEMDARLLQKIEELTLYVIEQNKKLEAQQKEIEALKEKAAE